MIAENSTSQHCFIAFPRGITGRAIAILCFLVSFIISNSNDVIRAGDFRQSKEDLKMFQINKTVIKTFITFNFFLSKL